MKKCKLPTIFMLAMAFSPQLFASSECENRVSESWHGVQGQLITFVTDANDSVSRWVCLDGNVAIAARRGTNGAYYSLALGIRSIPFELLKQEKSIVRQRGYALVQRLVVQERTGLDRDNQYWLIDVRERTPLVVGPFGRHDASEDYSVLWGVGSVTVVFDERKIKWKPGDRFFVEEESIKGKDGRLTPILTIDGKPSKKKEGFTAYHYDYTTKKVTEALLMVD